MASIPANIHRVYEYLFYDLADPRTRKWFLVENPFHVILIIIVYVSFVTKWGPALMKDRKPFQLKEIMIVYNIFQILVNSFLFIQGLRIAYGPNGIYSIWCQPVDTSTSYFAMYACYCCYTYYLLKILDLLDTVFMVLRKKRSHISFLHVYHHAGMVPLAWGAVSYYPGGHACFFGFLNTFVHAIMYGYYLLSATYPPQERYRLGWKKYLTLLQLVQFFLMGVHISLPLFQPKCAYPKYVSFLVAPQVVFMVILFTDFYIKTYIKIRPSVRMNGSLEPKLNGINKLDENKNKIS